MLKNNNFSDDDNKYYFLEKLIREKYFIKSACFIQILLQNSVNILLHVVDQSVPKKLVRNPKMILIRKLTFTLLL